jgi:hypothetical protein
MQTEATPKEKTACSRFGSSDATGFRDQLRAGDGPAACMRIAGSDTRGGGGAAARLGTPDKNVSPRPSSPVPALKRFRVKCYQQNWSRSDAYVR